MTELKKSYAIKLRNNAVLEIPL